MDDRLSGLALLHPARHALVLLTPAVRRVRLREHRVMIGAVVRPDLVLEPALDLVVVVRVAPARDRPYSAPGALQVHPSLVDPGVHLRERRHCGLPLRHVSELHPGAPAYSRFVDRAPDSFAVRQRLGERAERVAIALRPLHPDRDVAYASGRGSAPPPLRCGTGRES